MVFTTSDGASFEEIEPGLFAILTNNVILMPRGASSSRLLLKLMDGRDNDLLFAAWLMLGDKISLPPFLELGIACVLKLMQKTGASEI